MIRRDERQMYISRYYVFPLSSSGATASLTRENNHQALPTRRAGMTIGIGLIAAGIASCEFTMDGEYAALARVMATIKINIKYFGFTVTVICASLNWRLAVGLSVISPFSWVISIGDMRLRLLLENAIVPRHEHADDRILARSEQRCRNVIYFARIWHESNKSCIGPAPSPALRLSNLCRKRYYARKSSRHRCYAPPRRHEMLWAFARYETLLAVAKIPAASGEHFLKCYIWR